MWLNWLIFQGKCKLPKLTEGDKQIKQTIVNNNRKKLRKCYHFKGDWEMTSDAFYKLSRTVPEFKEKLPNCFYIFCACLLILNLTEHKNKTIKISLMSLYSSYNRLSITELNSSLTLILKHMRTILIKGSSMRQSIRIIYSINRLNYVSCQ